MLWACCLVLSASCNNPEVKKESFTISGSLANKISAGDNLSLRISGEAENVATAVVTEEGTFTFNVNVEKEQYLTLYIEDRAVVEIITEGNDIAISMDEEDNHINIEGTRYNEIIRNFNDKVKPLVNALYSATSEAEAEKIRVSAKGDADAIYAKMEAEAKGLYEVLTKQASGYKDMVTAAGGDATKAYMLLLLEKLPDLVKTQVEAVKGINIDHVTVWDGGNGAEGKGSTANFVSGLMKSVPPLNDLFDMAGLSLPEYLAKKKDAEQAEATEVK